MKIVHLTATPDGAPWMIALAREQKKVGHEVCAILPSLHGTIAPALAEHGIPSYAAPVNVLDTGVRPQTIRDLIKLVRLLRRLRPDVVHSHIIASVVTGRIASWIADVPAHLGGNCHPISLESETLRLLEVGTAFCDTRTIASCEYTRRLFVEHGVPAEQVELVYYAVDQSGHDPARADGARVRREFGIAPETPVIGMIAYFYPPSPKGRSLPPSLWNRGVKGHDVLLRAVPRVLETVPDAKFVLVGRGWGERGAEYEQSIKDLAVSLGIAHAVIFPGERKDVPDVLASFDISVHCSHTDNLGGTVESLLMERPMVVSDTQGFADTVLHEKTGLVVPRDDPDALADAVVRLLGDRELATRLGKNGRAHMLSRFTLARAVADMEALFSRLPRRRGYRSWRTAARILAAPFRLGPIALRLRRFARS